MKRKTACPTDGVQKLVADRLRLMPKDLEPAFDTANLTFRTTDELTPLDCIVGQEQWRLRSLDFGLAVRHRGYNVFVSGMTGTGRKELLQTLLEPRASQEPTPDDWVYLHNFEDGDRPLAFRLPAGHGSRLRTALEQVIERLRQDLPAALKAKDFDAERERLSTTYGSERGPFKEVLKHAARLQMGLRQLPKGNGHLPAQRRQADGAGRHRTA